MKRREQNILQRLYSIVHTIPGCNLGVATQSATLDGLCTFAKDMSAIKKPMEDVLYYARIGDFDEAELILTAMEIWIEKRNVAKWQDVFPFPEVRA